MSDPVTGTTKPMSKTARRRVAVKLRLGKQSDWKCAYCGCRLWPHTLTVDHIIPQVRAGSRIEGNKLPACEPCNSSKGDRRTMTFIPSPKWRNRSVQNAG